MFLKLSLLVADEADGADDDEEQKEGASCHSCYEGHVKLGPPGQLLTDTHAACFEHSTSNDHLKKETDTQPPMRT